MDDFGKRADAVMKQLSSFDEAYNRDIIYRSIRAAVEVEREALRDNLNDRDDFLVERGLFIEFTDWLKMRDAIRRRADNG